MTTYWHEDPAQATERISDAIDFVFSQLRKYHTAAAVNKKLNLTTHNIILQVKAEWANDFAILTPELVHVGLKKATRQGNDWCPTLAQFINMCRPSAEEAYIEAQIGLNARSRGEKGKWSCPAVYSAALEFGSYEIKTANWHNANKRWTKIWEDNWDKQEAGKLPAIPEAIPTHHRIEHQPNTIPNPIILAKIEATINKLKASVKANVTKNASNANHLDNANNLNNPNHPTSATQWAWHCKTRTAAQLLSDSLNKTEHRSALHPAGQHHLITGKLSKEGNTWKIGNYWRKPKRS